jgi:hypothetical protein
VGGIIYDKESYLSALRKVVVFSGCGNDGHCVCVVPKLPTRNKNRYKRAFEPLNPRFLGFDGSFFYKKINSPNARGSNASISPCVTDCIGF